MFFEALLKLILVFILGTFLATLIWLSIYRFLGFLMPSWLAGYFAKGIIWTYHQKPTNLAILALVASAGVDVFIWHSLWFWTLLIGGVGAFAVWFFSKE